MNKIKSQASQDIAELQQEEKQSWLEISQTGSEISFRLNKEIKPPEYYSDLLDRLELASENDTIKVYIDTIGGDLDGCIAICDGLLNTEADVIGIITNKAYSAGAFIALSCENLVVRPYARMMAHSYSGTYGGKDHEIELDYGFNKDYIHNFLSNCCQGFLSEEELEEMFAGKDWWFNAEEIAERLNNRNEYFNSLTEEDNLNLDEDELPTVDLH